MAFVPNVHNRAVPIANRQIYWREQATTQNKHIQALNRMGPAIDNKWGQMRNGVREQKKASYSHVKCNLKRMQLQDERYAEIELENFLLLSKLGRILERPHNPTKGTREFGGGMRLDCYQVPVIDHCVASKTNEFGAALEPTSLSVERRQREQEQIMKENRALVARLQAAKPTYDVPGFEQDAHNRDVWRRGRGTNIKLCGAIAAPLDSTLQKPYFGRPQSAPIGRQGVRPQSAAGGSSRRPDRPRTAMPRPISAPAADGEADAAFYRVLQLLAEHMQGAHTLEQMREARDSLMEREAPLPAGTSVSLLDAGSVEIEVVKAADCAAGDETILMLAHGGIFMSGAPRGVRHLAARLSAELRLPVATPKLRLAPQFRCPAPADDLSAAYHHLMRHGLGGAPSGSRRIALWAESSGGGLALSLTLRLLAASGVEPPCALVLASPWLDLTCSGGSYIVNESHDPVMRSGKLRQCAAAYLNGLDAADPVHSPVAAPTAAFTLMPPTLIHVGDTEVVLDDSRALHTKLQEAGASVEIKEFRRVLHAWHGFFPIMPAAEEAVVHAIGFLRAKLRLPLPPSLSTVTEAEDGSLASAFLAASSTSDFLSSLAPAPAPAAARRAEDDAQRNRSVEEALAAAAALP